MRKRVLLGVAIGFGLVSSIVTNIVLGVAFFDVRQERHYANLALDSTLEQMAHFDGNTWLWRVNGTGEKYGWPFTSHVLLYVNENGQQTPLYQDYQDNTFGSFDWSFSDNGERVVITDTDGAPEGAVYTRVVFEKDQELFRIVYDSYGSYVDDFTFQRTGSTEYLIELQTTNKCGQEEGDKTTELLGVAMTSAFEGQKTFELPEPVTVPCQVIDGVTSDPPLLTWGIGVDTYGVSFTLPGGTRAYIPVDESSGTVRVNYY